MAQYQLQPNEVIVLPAARVQRGNGLLPTYSDDLVLTNLHLIWVNKGVCPRFG